MKTCSPKRHRINTDRLMTPRLCVVSAEKFSKSLISGGILHPPCVLPLNSLIGFEAVVIMWGVSLLFISLGGPTPYNPIGIYDQGCPDATSSKPTNEDDAIYKRARVLCSYDANGSNELCLSANEVCGQAKLNTVN